MQYITPAGSAHAAAHAAFAAPQVEGYERSRMALAKSFFENKMRSDAAKVIQRHWRHHRLQRMRRQQTEGYQVGMVVGLLWVGAAGVRLAGPLPAEQHSRCTEWRALRTCHPSAFRIDTPTPLPLQRRR